MYQYQNNILSVPAKLLYDDWGVMTYNTYKSYCNRGKLIKTKEGRGKGNQAWLSFYDLPPDYKAKCIKHFGKPEEVIVVNGLEEWIIPDPKAANFYAAHRKPNGKALAFELQREKATNAMILNAIETIINDRVKCNRIFGKKKTKIWENISEAVNALDGDKWHFKLPGNHRALQRKYNEYIKHRYMTFIHKGEGSDNARKVTTDVERLIIGLYCQPNKPYGSKTHDEYLKFMGGALQVFDIETGEVFNREDFFNDNGQPIELSESTILNYINKPDNDLIIQKYRNGDYDFSHKVRPHVNRHAPEYSMSKISLDDRDIMHTKLPDGGKVMAYYAYDVMSTAMIGIAHSKSKNAELYLDCLRNMFQFTTSYGIGIPMQMEVEQHLVSDFKDGLMKANVVFPMVRWCNPTNSQEKWAETGIRGKKYGVEKDNNQNVGRHYARRQSNRVTRQKVFDEFNDNYKEAKADYETIVANDLAEQYEYNNELHPNQAKFKGLTRLQVFLQNVFPNLPKLNKPLLAKFIGIHTATSIRRSQYVHVKGEKFQLPNPQVLSMLAPNNYKVDAYYIPSANEIKEVYIYQNGEYLCTCKPVPRFNTANAEWTDVDRQKYQEAMEYIRKFDGMVKEMTAEKLPKVSTLKTKHIPEAVTVETVPEPQEEQYNYQTSDYTDLTNRAINDL